MSEPRDLLSRTAEIAADYLESLGERPVFPRTTRRRCGRRSAGRCPRSPTDPPRWWTSSPRRPSRARRDAERPLLRLRDRRRGARGARGRLAHLRLGPERRPLRRRPVGGGGRGGGPANGCSSCSACPANRRSASSRAADGALDRACGSALPRARRGRLGRRARRPHRRAARPRDRRREAARDRRPGAAPARPRRADRPSRPTTRAAWCAAALREALGEGPTIVCAQAGEVNTGAFDPLPAIADACEPARRLAARRRRLRHLGGGLAAAFATSSTASSGPTRGRPTRTSG